MPNFVPISQTAGDKAIFQFFFKMAAVRLLGFV